MPNHCPVGWEIRSQRSELRSGRGLSRALICPQCPYDALELPFEPLVAPTPAGEVGGQPGLNLLSLAARPLEQKTIDIERDERQHFPAALLHEASLFFKGQVNLIVDPPARQGRLRATQQHLIPEPDTTVDLLINVITGKHLVFVCPTANPTPLELVMQAAGEGLIGMAVANKTVVVLKRAPDQRFHIGDDVVRDARASEEDLGDVALREIKGIDADG
jgi:hypothetical protein